MSLLFSKIEILGYLIIILGLLRLHLSDKADIRLHTTDDTCCVSYLAAIKVKIQSYKLVNYE